MADGQPTALGTGCHTGSETSVGLPGEQKLYVRRAAQPATCDLNHILTSCEQFEKRPSKDDIVKMEELSVRWLSAIAVRT